MNQDSAASTTNNNSNNNTSTQDIKKLLLTPGALYDSVISNPNLRSFHWVQSELQNETKLKTGKDMIGTATKLNKNAWSKPGESDLTCPFKTLPVDVLPSDLAKNQLLTQQQQEKGNSNNNGDQHQQQQPRRVFQD